MFKQSLLLLTGFLAGAILTVTVQPHADVLDGKTTFDLGAGECRYTRAPNGTWRQDNFQNSARMVDNCQSLGFSFQPVHNWTFGLHYVSLAVAGAKSSLSDEEVTALNEQEAYEAKSDVKPEDRFALLHPMECTTWIAQCNEGRCKPRFVCTADLTRRMK